MDGSTITEFMLRTCRQERLPNIRQAEIILSCYRPIGMHYERFITGSAAEIYIEPILTCIGDIDIMSHPGIILAIPSGHAVPSQLPPYFFRVVFVLEIHDSHLPGYVYLKKLCTMVADHRTYRYGGDNIVYAVKLCNTQTYMSNKMVSREDDSVIHGPATKIGERGAVIHYFGNEGLDPDIVFCIRCLVWPLHAGNWQTRQRNCGWPDAATKFIQRMVSNGCDVVPVAHRRYRQDDWMNKY